LEFGHNYIRVYKDGGQVQTADANTKLLIHGDGVPASTSFTDNGNTGHVVATNGNAQVSSIRKFGTGSILLDGTGDYLSLFDHDDFDFGSGKFTIDFWMRPSNLPGEGNNAFIFDQYKDADEFFRGAINNTGGTYTFKFQFNSESTTTLMTASYGAVAALLNGTWAHVAIIRGWGGNANDWAVCIDGVAQDTETSLAKDMPNATGGLFIGCDYAGANAFEGRIDEFRISKGVARWTANFNPPRSEYPGGDSSGTAVEVATTYTEAQIADLQFTQSADTLYIVHPDHAPAKLTRTSDTSWTLTTITFAWPAFLAINTTSTTLQSDNAAVGAGRTITASADLFDSDHVNGHFAFKDGYVKITAVGSATSATATVVSALDDTGATADWYESAFSTYQGFPSAVAFYEDRLSFGGTSRSPDTMWLSKSGLYEDFRRGAVTGETVASDDAISITLASREVNAIRWMVGATRLIVGTTGGEWWIEGASSSEPLDATKVPRAKMDSEHGSADIQPVQIGNTVIFVQRMSKVIREMRWDWQFDQYVANDLSLLSEHYFNYGEIKGIAYQQTPHKILWIVHSDGNLYGCTYMREHEVIAWHKHTASGTSASFESVAVVEGSEEDELWVVVARTINNAATRFVERMKPISAIDTGEEGSSDWDLEDAYFVDSGVTYRGGSSTAMNWLTHLEGESVVSLADGTAVSAKTVTSGAITLSSAASTVHIGLNYNADVETLEPVLERHEAMGQSTVKHINNVTLRLYRSLNGQVGPDSSNLRTIPYDDTSDYYTGDTRDIAIKGGYDQTGTVYIRKNEPLPLTVSAIILDVEA
jgi:hypothetical protein